MEIIYSIFFIISLVFFMSVTADAAKIQRSPSELNEYTCYII